MKKNKYIIDIETTSFRLPGSSRGNPSPYIPENKLVTFQAMNVDTKEKVCYVFEHKDNTQDVEYNTKMVQQILNNTELFIAHNAKFDASFLYECGFKYDGKFFDTMIFQYICNKGNKSSLALKDLAIAYNLPLKLDIWEKYWNEGLNTDEMPLSELIEYALGDLETTYELYMLQRKQYAENKDVQFMYPAIELTNEALEVIIEMERNGCYIDKAALEEVEKEYINELNTLTRGIQSKVNDLMGDTPINLSSPDDMSMLLYGLEVKDKKVWADKFGIGTSERNSVKKRKYPKRMGPSELRKTIRENTETVYKTEAEQCVNCVGKGKIRKVKKDSTPFKKESICASCNGNGFIYNVSHDKAGLCLKPISSQYATAAGFAADKKVIEQYLSRESLDDETKAFLKVLQRQSSITTYLSTFIEGIKNNVKEDMLLHTSLNQCITATGRLSSSNPNFQNLPRASTFPVRKAIKSRFPEGKILDVDFTGLEYRCAVMLAQCSMGLQSIVEGKDRHEITTEIIYGISKCDVSADIWNQSRQSAKAHTFKPLYGGESGTEAEKVYYKAFLEEHTGIKKWHDELCYEAMENGQVKTPTGRIFAFPNARRGYDGKIKGKTQIVNYPVQSVATADIIWIVVVDIYNKMKKLNLKSKLILQVHDSAIADVHPTEQEVMIKLFKDSFDKVHKLLYSRYKYQTKVPINYEMKLGKSWGDMKKVA